MLMPWVRFSNYILSIKLIMHTAINPAMKFDPSRYPAHTNLATHREWISESVRATIQAL